MKNILIILIAVISFSALAQTSGESVETKYQKGMSKAFQLWDSEQSWEAANMFERIATVEQDNWLPPFYVAQINIFNSFTEKDKSKVTAQLNKARDFINDAMAISKDNPEIMVLEAQWYTAWVVFDGQQYGMKYSPKIAELYQKALQLAPENPRVVLGKAEWDIGSAQFFGQPVDKYCIDLNKAVALFDTFKPVGEFYPQGGKEYAMGVLERTCKK